MYYHEEKGIRCMVHGDDFVTVWRRGKLRWFQKCLKGRFETKETVVGTGPGEETEVKVLNRIIRVTAEGWEYEADQRHAELIVDEAEFGSV